MFGSWGFVWIPDPDCDKRSTRLPRTRVTKGRPLSNLIGMGKKTARSWREEPRRQNKLNKFKEGIIRGPYLREFVSLKVLYSKKNTFLLGKSTFCPKPLGKLRYKQKSDVQLTPVCQETQILRVKNVAFPLVRCRYLFFLLPNNFDLRPEILY